MRVAPGALQALHLNRVNDDKCLSHRALWRAVPVIARFVWSATCRVSARLLRAMSFDKTQLASRGDEDWDRSWSETRASSRSAFAPVITLIQV